MEFKGNVQWDAVDDKENVDSGLNAQEVKEFCYWWENLDVGRWGDRSGFLRSV